MNTPKQRQDWIANQISKDKQVLSVLEKFKIVSRVQAKGLQTAQQRFDCLINIVRDSIADIENNRTQEHAPLDDAAYYFDRELNKSETSDLLSLIKETMAKLIRIAYGIKIPCALKNKYKARNEYYPRRGFNESGNILKRLRNPVIAFINLSGINKSNYRNYVNSSPIDYYVYALYDTTNDRVFYVGKGKGQRMYKHRTCTDNPVKCSYIESIQGNYIELVLIDGLTNEKALDEESKIIKNNYEELTNVSNPCGSRSRSKFNSLPHFVAYAKKFGVNEVVKINYDG